jgi:hypothetical protein
MPAVRDFLSISRVYGLSAGIGESDLRTDPGIAQSSLSYRMITYWCSFNSLRKLSGLCVFCGVCFQVPSPAETRRTLRLRRERTANYNTAGGT